MKKFLMIALVAIGFAVTAHAQPGVMQDPAADKNAPHMKFKHDTIDAGTITQGAQIDTVFRFTNSGKSPLVITNATAPCGCTVPSFNREPIAAGKSDAIKVHFNSAGKMGQQYKTITITSNDGSGTVYVTLKVNIVAAPVSPTGTADPQRSGAPTNGN